MPTPNEATPRERYAAGDTLQALLDAMPATGSNRDNRIRARIAAAAVAMQRGRDPLEAAEQAGRGI